ncbi:unnamed protein product [Vicia faba]|uniref:Uncharacterized protein n=1 Tax=Vicia faba TaxID=3906 RepID=A0AAV1ATK0_VICFA|nr:unnamed protein product [Vicia faba]CAI8612406.1 unnamed protein product [Vicia faba]
METVGGQKERAGFRSVARTEGGRDPLAVQADSSVAASGDACSAARLRCVGGQKFGGGDSCGECSRACGDESIASREIKSNRSHNLSNHTEKTSDFEVIWN